MIVSIVIPAHNEQARVASCLEALAGQITTHTLDIIVVDNASTDATATTAQTFTATLPLRVVSEPTLGRGAARRHGFGLARGDIILSTDADTIVPSGWVEALVQNFHDPAIVATTGPCAILDCAPFTNRTFNWLQPNLMRAYRLLFGHYWLTGSNCALRRSVYKAAGGFDPSVRDLEDIELGFRIAKLGRIRFIPSITVITAGDRFQHGLILGLASYARTFIGRFALRQDGRFDRPISK